MTHHGLKLYAFTCGWLNMPRGFFLDGEGNDLICVPVPAYFIDHPKGKAVFDTGLGTHSPGHISKIRGSSAELDPSADIAARLRSIDIDPLAINYIINSHLHTDHCGANASLPNATVIVQDAELQAARGGAPAYDAAEWDLGQKIMTLRGECDLFGDGSVSIFPTPGHTAGHQCAKIRLPKGDVILAADCCYMRASLDRFHLPRFSADAGLQLASLQHLSRLRDAGARIFFGHDPEFWKTVPQGKPLA